MDSFLSNFSHNYGGTQIGQSYTGNITSSGNVDVNGAQGFDTTQLQPGDTFQGEITSVNGEDVQIQLANGQFMAAKLERDVQVALGQILNLQVQSNKNNRIVLKPVSDGNSTLVRVGEAALKAANMAVNEKNLTLVSKLIENGMPINKNSLMTFKRLALQNSQVNMDDIIKLNKLKLPVNDNNITQLQNYQNMQHKLIDGINEASDEILKLYDIIRGDKGTGGNMQQLSMTNANTAVAQGNVADAGKFMEQVLALLSGDDTSKTVWSNQNQIINENSTRTTINNTDINSVQTDAQNVDINNVQTGEQNTNANILSKTDIEHVNNQVIDEKNTQGKILNQLSENMVNDQSVISKNNGVDITKILELLKSEKPQTIPSKVIGLITNDKIDIKSFNHILTETDIGKMLTTEQKAEIFQSEPFKSMIKKGLQKQWTLTPQKIVQDGKVEEFYQKLMKESSQLSKMMNEALQGNSQSLNNTQMRAMSNISENVEFINQMNQMFTYVQLPLKLSNSQAHGDLYVYTNKRNMSHNDGMLTAFLHLDMDNLGSLDISIALQTEKNQVTTKFYLDEDSIEVVEEHIDELVQKLAKKGYKCKNMVLEKEENKTVLEHMEEQISGGNTVISYQTFDTRA